MGLFNFLKKKKKIKEETKKKLDFSEIEDWVNGELKNNPEKEILSNLDEKTNKFTENLKEKLEVLSNFDVDSCKSGEKEKSIVKQGKIDYIEKTQRLISDIKNIKEHNLENYVSKINELFADFYKKTDKSYQKANYFIGKELNEIKNSLGEFSKEIINVFSGNRSLAEKTKKIDFVKPKLDKIKESEKEIKEIEDYLKELQEKLLQKENKKQDVLDKIKEIKESEDYLKNLEKKKEVYSIKREREILIKNLKEKIDFKKLSNFMHVFPEKIKIIKEYKENFLDSFNENKDKIINLLTEANLKTPEIKNKLEEIQKKEKLLEELKNKIKEDKTEMHYKEIEKEEADIEGLEKTRVSKEKRKKRLEDEKKDLMDLVKKSVNSLD